MAYRTIHCLENVMNDWEILHILTERLDNCSPFSEVGTGWKMILMDKTKRYENANHCALALTVPVESLGWRYTKTPLHDG